MESLSNVEEKRKRRSGGRPGRQVAEYEVAVGQEGSGESSIFHNHYLRTSSQALLSESRELERAKREVVKHSGYLYRETRRSHRSASRGRRPRTAENGMVDGGADTGRNRGADDSRLRSNSASRRQAFLEREVQFVREREMR